MQPGIEQIKHSATWGGAKSNPSPTQNHESGTQVSRRRSNAKRAAQFLLCFGLVLMFTINASAKKLSKQLSPDLYKMVQTGDPDQTVDVIVQYKKRLGKKDIDEAVHKRKARLRRQLQAVNGMQLTISLKEVKDLADDKEVRYVSLDRKVKMNVDTTTYAVSADIAWSYGYDGRGIGIAIIDSGIKSHSDLNQWGLLSSRVVYSESFVPGDPSTIDAYGHGTHVAGTAASNGYSSRYGYVDQYKGVAPAAHIINLRVLDGNGCGTDSSVIAAIQRAIDLKNVYNIRVMNLSLGRGVYESFMNDPLNQAVEKAWQAGIVVVVAAGNKGRDESMGTSGYGTIGSPANDPYVITVGAMDTLGTATPADDKVATYSSKGPTLIDHVVKPDIVAPGDKVISLRSANSTLDLASPTSQVTCIGCSTNTAKYFKLSGTSMATPVVSGAVALMLQKDPSLTPDVVKARLMKSATKNIPIFSYGADRFRRKFKAQYDVFTYGSGYLNIAAALSNNESGSGTALSPRAIYNTTTGQVTLDTSNWVASGLLDKVFNSSVLWGESVMWGDSVLWGESVIWGNTALLSGSSVLWGDSVVWGNTQEQGFSVLWGESVIWGSYTGANEAFSEVEGGDCRIDDAGEIICEQ